MCISPQRRTIFQHLNFQKWSRIAVFCAFSLPNVLFATAACNFSASELPKVVPDPQFFVIFTSECAFRHSGVQFLMSPLSTYLRTRRFNRPTFGLTRHANLWKNTAFRDFSNIWRGRIFFLLTFWLLHLLSTDLTTLLLLFNSPYCRKFLFKLPSISRSHWTTQTTQSNTVSLVPCIEIELSVSFVGFNTLIGELAFGPFRSFTKQLPAISKGGGVTNFSPTCDGWCFEVHNLGGHPTHFNSWLQKLRKL